MAYIYDLTDTWSAAGTVFNGIKLNVTNTASAAASKLVTLQIGGTEHFSVTKAGVGYFSGNLGIGNTSPNALLELSKASGAADLRLSVNGTLYANIYASASDTNIFGVQNLPLIFGTNNTERMRITGGGNVGIGTSSPGAKFQVIGSTTVGGYANVAAAFGAGVSSELYLGSLNGNNPYIGSGGAFPLSFNTNGTERMRIDSSGNVGIGVVPSAWTSGWTGFDEGGYSALATASTGYTFVANNLYVGAGGWTYKTTNAGALYEMGVTGQHVWYNTASGTSGTGAALSERMRITSGGSLLVGTTAPMAASGSNEFKITSAGVWPLSLNGNDRGLLVRNSSASSGFYAYFEYNGGTNNGSISWSGGTTAYNTTSDYRLKEIDGPITNSGAYIDALKPVEGWWKADGKRFIGFLAHQVQEVSQTSVVVGEKDGAEMQQMDYSAPELIANLIAEVQSLRARVAQLEGN